MRIIAQRSLVEVRRCVRHFPEVANGNTVFLWGCESMRNNAELPARQREAHLVLLVVPRELVPVVQEAQRVLVVQVDEDELRIVHREEKFWMRGSKPRAACAAATLAVPQPWRDPW